MRDAFKLARFFDNQLNSDLKSVMIVQDKTGSYELFGKYSIKQDILGQFDVTDITTSNKLSFSSLKNAMCWCTLYNEKMYTQANRLHTLEMKLVSLQTDLIIHKKLYNNTSTRNRLIYLIKMQEDNHKRRMILKEINSLINSSKNIQLRKFNKKRDFAYS